MASYYNDNDPYVCEWLRNLISEGLIADGDVDERSISEVGASDVKGYTQAHFFAGIGGWSYALRLAGWPDDEPVWTGSCPCQPFSAAGKRLGTDDPRHLWPEWLRLIGESRPPVVFGEQVASKDGRLWLSAVRADLEAMGYAVGCADLCAAGVGAPHIRQRLWFVGDSTSNGQPGAGVNENPDGKGRDFGAYPAKRTSATSELADTMRSGRTERRAIAGGGQATGGGESGELADAKSERPERRSDTRREREADQRKRNIRSQSQRLGWDDCEWLPCSDGKARPVEPGTFPLATGIPARVGRLRAYGNSIVPQVAAEFVMAYREAKARAG